MESEKQDLLSIIEELEDMKRKKPRLYLDIKETVECLEKKKLTEIEQKKLKEICCIMQQDKSTTLDKCLAIAAFVISVLAAIVSSVSLTLSAVNNSKIVVYITIGSIIFILLAVVIPLFISQIIKKNAKSADIYRNTCIALTMLSDEQLQDSEK